MHAALEYSTKIGNSEHHNSFYSINAVFFPIYTSTSPTYSHNGYFQVITTNNSIAQRILRNTLKAGSESCSQ